MFYSFPMVFLGFPMVFLGLSSHMTPLRVNGSSAVIPGIKAPGCCVVRRLWPSPSDVSWLINPT